jgi:hypothetical protein
LGNVAQHGVAADGRVAAVGRRLGPAPVALERKLKLLLAIPHFTGQRNLLDSSP